jgi:uncharacterized membrane protein (DUF485 family)
MPVTMLWLPILVSAVLVLIASNILWMLLPFWHRKDYGKLPQEGQVLDALASTPSGQYIAPCVEWGKLSAAEKAALQSRPSAMLLVRNPNRFSFGQALVVYFLYNLVIAFFVAYLAARALGVGATYSQVFRFVGTAGILAYTFGSIPDSIWYGKPWSATLKFVVDGILYGLLMAGTFGWLWPK